MSMTSKPAARNAGVEGGNRAPVRSVVAPCARASATHDVDVVPVGHHVMIEQNEMRDVGFVGPSTETSSDGMLGRRRVHGTEGTRTSDGGDRTASDASAPVVV